MCKPWIKITRDFITHKYFHNAVHLQFVLYLLTQAEYTDTEELQRGCVAISVKAYAKEYNVPERSIRDFLKTLIADGTVEVVSRSPRKGTILRICNYDKYQSSSKEVSPRNEPHIQPRNEPHNEKSSETPLYKGEVDTSEISAPRIQPRNEPRIQPRIQPLARNTNPRVLEEEKKERKEILSNESTKKAADAASHAPVSPPSPSLEEVQTHAAATGIHPEIAEAFFWYYESRGWIGANGNPIRSWQAALRLWRARESQYANRQTTQHETAHHAQQSPADRREAERLAREQATLCTINQLLDQARAKQLAACRSPNASNFLP